MWKPKKNQFVRKRKIIKQNNNKKMISFQSKQLKSFEKKKPFLYKKKAYFKEIS